MGSLHFQLPERGRHSVLFVDECHSDWESLPGTDCVFAIVAFLGAPAGAD